MKGEGNVRNDLQMQKTQKDMEWKCICEDSKTKVYLSVIPPKESPEERHMDIVNAVMEALKYFFGPVMERMIQVLLTVGITMLFNELISEQLRALRGYDAVGGELFLIVAVGLIVFRITDCIFKRWRWL